MNDKKKILCIGNMNNNMFAIARYLRDRGYDATVYLTVSDLKQYHPSNDSYSAEYEKYTKQISWGGVFISQYDNTSAEQVKHDTDGFDIIIGCGPIPAYLKKINRRIDFFIPHSSHGRDGFLKLFSRKEDYYNWYKLFKKIRFNSIQKKAISESKYVLIEYSNDESEECIRKLNLTGKRVQMTSPVLYYPEYIPENIKKHLADSIYYERFKAIKEKYSFAAFHHSRHVWTPKAAKQDNGLADKGNDKVIKGFKMFLEETGANACLILFEYSVDVEASKELIAELGIEKNVEWFPLMPRKEIMLGLTMSNVGIGEIGNPWITYGTVLEMMAAGKPIIMNRSKTIQDKYSKMYPHRQAANEDEVCEGLKYYYGNKEYETNDGKLCQEWFIRYLVDKNVNKLIELIEI